MFVLAAAVQLGSRHCDERQHEDHRVQHKARVSRQERKQVEKNMSQRKIENAGNMVLGIGVAVLVHNTWIEEIVELISGTEQK